VFNIRSASPRPPSRPA